MDIETAIKKLREEYERARNLEYIRNPLAYALFQVWKLADKNPERTNMPRSNGTISFSAGAAEEQ